MNNGYHHYLPIWFKTPPTSLDSRHVLWSFMNSNNNIFCPECLLLPGSRSKNKQCRECYKVNLWYCQVWKRSPRTQQPPAGLHQLQRGQQSPEYKQTNRSYVPAATILHPHQLWPQLNVASVCLVLEVARPRSAEVTRVTSLQPSHTRLGCQGIGCHCLGNLIKIAGWNTNSCLRFRGNTTRVGITGAVLGAARTGPLSLTAHAQDR